MRYTRGDTVVHPQHGAATVGGTVKKDMGSGPEDYLELHITFPALTIMVPERSLGEVGVRDLLTRKEAEQILAILHEPSDVPETWSERNVFTASRMKSTELDQKSMVIRDLSRHALRTGKPLSVGENRALESCLDTVSQELSLALGLSGDETRALITQKTRSSTSDTVASTETGA